MTGPKVLVADDSLTVRMDLQEALGDAGFEVVLAADLATARRILGTEAPDLVLLDVTFPDGSGLDLLQEIRDGPGGERLKIILLSSEAGVRERIRGLARGADDYAGKPYDRDFVVERARRLLAPTADPSGTSEAPRILVVDDSATWREELGAVLRTAGYRVDLAGTGQEGLRAAARGGHALFLVDGVLPDMEGADLVRTMDQDPVLRRVPCLMLTASDASGREVAALQAGVDGYVRKDQGLEVVLSRVQRLLAGRAGAGAVPARPGLFGPKRVLAVDDSETFLQVLAENLGHEGYDVVLARSGEEALELLGVQPVDVVLVDLVMPGLGGKDICLRIRASELWRDLPVLILTARDERAAMLEGIDAGADDYIPKTAGFDVIRARVRAQLRRKQVEAETRRIREDLLAKDLEATRERAARELAESRAAFAEELAEKNRELELANEALSAFNASVAHDLRAPITVIMGFAEALSEDYGGVLDQEGLDYLRRIRRAADRTRELVDDLLWLARSAVTPLRLATVDLSALAREILHGFAEREPDRKVEVRIDPGCQVEGDAGLLRIALENLLSNAWKFTRGREPATVEFRSCRSGDAPEFLVRDDGAGFDPGQAHRLFGVFQRLHAPDQFEGTGIGLATVQRIVRRHGGTVSAESSPGRGACFRFTLPEAAAAGDRP